METTYLDLANSWAASHMEVIREAGEHWLAHGTWKTAFQLGRSALRRDPDVDVFAALQELPPPLGRVEFPEDFVVFRPRALALLPDARPLLEAFVAALRLAASRLIGNDDEHPVLRDRDLTETLKMRAESAERVSQLVLAENWIFGGGSGSADGSWERKIDEGTRAVLGVDSVESYLQVEGQRFWTRSAGAPALRATLPLVSAGQSGNEAPEGALLVQELHPVIGTVSAPLVLSGLFDEAVRAGAIAFRDLLRERSGLTELDGTALAGAALGGVAPAIVLAEDRAEQGGWRMLAQGCFAAIRNPVAHRRVYTDRAATVDALATMSLIARRINAAAPPSADAESAVR